MAGCCTCAGAPGVKSPSLPLICLVPREDGAPGKSGPGQPRPASASAPSSTGGAPFQFLDEEYLKKHFKLGPRAQYLDPFRRPLITFPMSQGDEKNFNMARKTKINQAILDGTLDGSEAISAPSVFPYSKSEAEKKKEADENEEIIYILQLPDWEYQCPVHNQTIRTPRFIWHSCKKTADQKESGPKRGGGPMNKPKPWLLSRHTDFDLLSQW